MGIDSGDGAIARTLVTTPRLNSTARAVVAFLGSARASRAHCGALAAMYVPERKARDGEGRHPSTRGACAPRISGISDTGDNVGCASFVIGIGDPWQQRRFARD